MTTLDDTSSFLSKERIVAPEGFNRWLVPPAALAIHLCIGMAYGFSVFWLPLSKALGIKDALKCGPDIGFFQELFITTCDWKVSTLGWMYTLFFVLLGSSAALWGGWLERAGPRKAGVVSASFLTFAVVLGEYTVASLLLKFTLPAYLAEAQGNNPQGTFTVGLLLIVVTALLLGVINRVTRSKSQVVSNIWI